MLVVRNVLKSDLDSLYQLISQSELGLTTLKVSKEKLRARIEQALFAFQQESAKPLGQPYVFVMEDLSNGKIVGTSAIYSKVGGFEPFYSYRIETTIHQSAQLGVKKEIQVLHLHVEHNGPTEIGSLFLDPQYWGRGNGRLLSIARFLFMADFPERFESEVIAEMRGVVNEDGKSPLWTAVGSHFFQIDFPKAETLTSESKKFIADLMPRHPIYIPLLPLEAQQVIGQVHNNTQPALVMLEKEGFEFRDMVDIFDGGPALHCETAKIRAVRQSRSGTVNDILEKVVGGTRLLVSNSNIDYRCCLGDVLWQQENRAVIDEVTALRLKLHEGDPLRCVELKPAND